MKTIIQAKTHLRENFEEGSDCPCCGQLVKLYKIKFNSNMAIFLISLVNTYLKERKPVHFKDCVFGSRNYPYIAKWNLAYTEKSEDTAKRTSGFWIPTKKGVDFVLNKVKVSEYKNIFNNKVLGSSLNEINIKDALGTKFNYEELMNNQ